MAEAVPKRVTLMPRPKCTVAWLLLIPAFGAAQTTETPPARHDSVEVRATAPTAPAGTSPAQTVKAVEVKELPSRPATVNYVLPLLPGIKVSPKNTVRLSMIGHNLTNHFNALAVHANVADPAFGVFFGDYPRRFRADFDVIF